MTDNTSDDDLLGDLPSDADLKSITVKKPANWGQVIAAMTPLDLTHEGMLFLGLSCLETVIESMDDAGDRAAFRYMIGINVARGIQSSADLLPTSKRIN